MTSHLMVGSNPKSSPPSGAQGDTELISKIWMSYHCRQVREAWCSYAWSRWFIIVCLLKAAREFFTNGADFAGRFRFGHSFYPGALLK